MARFIILFIAIFYAFESLQAHTEAPTVSEATDSTVVTAALDELTVTANQVIHSKGRTIVFPTATDIKASPTSLSLFQKLPLPGLEANPINRTLSVDGGTPVLLIDGVPSSIEQVNALQPKNIAKIEFSRFTPARYADSGYSGLINITLKQRTDGGDFYLWTRSALTTAFMDANLQTSYHQGPSQFTLQYVPSWRNYQKVYDYSSKSYIGDDFRVNLEERDRSPFNYHSHTVKLKYDYSPSEKTLFSATLNTYAFLYKSLRLAHTLDSELGEYSNDNIRREKTLRPSLDLFLRQDFNDKNSLELQVVGTLNMNDYRRDNKYLFADDAEQSYIMNVDSRRRSLISEASYNHSFGKRSTLSAGYQNTLSRSTNTYLDSDYKPVLTENNNYVYLRLGQSVGQVYLSLATGAKMFWINNDLTRRHFIRNLSSAQVSWNIDRHWSLQGSFKYSPSIPSLSDLTDYPQQTSPYLVSNGNPNLKVAQNFEYSLSADYSAKIFKVSLQSSYRDTKDCVVSDVVYSGNRLFLSQSVNARYLRVFSNRLNFMMNSFHGFGVQVSANLSNYRCAGDRWNHDLTTLSSSATVWWTKGPFTIGYWQKIPGKYLNGHSVGKEENGNNFEIDWQPDKHWTIEASWMYMLVKKGSQYPSWDYSKVNPSQLQRYIKDNANMIVLSVIYSADFGTIFRSTRRNLNNSDSSSSLLKY